MFRDYASDIQKGWGYVGVMQGDSVSVLLY